ncbi:lasso peptide biosynthesis B2 protein [Bacillus sp. BRMEA1]|uniref:lasso peptide biosynthesis B2 protein n=1 Tax=Neobacillus endophyticus TaxID=2738405 RepID=UPI0015666164|nr:lasso peptide biosynthesis B2 protein [Neobacillus endophyticus]NRD76972.1 lasso peptide biosynthesis B2 protein [Neobacillus endophyticus]
MEKVINFLKLPWKTKLLLVEAFFNLGRARYLKRIPFENLALVLGEPMKETDYSPNEFHKDELIRISRAIYQMSRYTFWESECMVKAIAGMKMLERRHIASTIYFGTAKDEKGALIAHAWLRCGPYYISGAEGMERFTVVAKFAKQL